MILSPEHEGKGKFWRSLVTEINEGKKYQGQWTNSGHYEGLGTLWFADGSIYQGQTFDGRFNGKGRMTHSNGDIYQGEWRDGKANGFGVYIDQNGSMYAGDWLDD